MKKNRFLLDLWALAVNASIIVLIVALVLPFFRELSETQHLLLTLAEYSALAILFVDIVALLVLAKNKRKFLLENWYIFASFLPFGAILRLARALRSIRLLASIELSGVFHVLAHSPKLARLFRPFAQVYRKFTEKLKRGS